MCCVDLEKAYPCFPRGVLSEVLQECEVPGSLLWALGPFTLRERESSIHSPGIKSTLNPGIPQEHLHEVGGSFQGKLLGGSQAVCSDPDKCRESGWVDAWKINFTATWWGFLNYLTLSYLPSEVRPLWFAIIQNIILFFQLFTHLKDLV